MRVAALYYIHGNIAAPEAVLAEVRAERTNLVVVGGEVLRGPMVRETLCCPRSGYESGSPANGTICFLLREAANLAERVAWHAEQDLTVSALRSGLLSTFRLTLLALNESNTQSADRLRHRYAVYRMGAGELSRRDREHRTG